MREQYLIELDLRRVPSFTPDVAVLGSGVMGSGIAAHLANAGVRSLMLDIVPKDLTPEDEKQGLSRSDPRFRNKLALAGLESIKKTKPAAIYSKRFLPLISVGNFEDDWAKLADCDWIVEVVVERLDIKQQVFERLPGMQRAQGFVSLPEKTQHLHRVNRAKRIHVGKPLLAAEPLEPMQCYAGNSFL